MGKGASTKTTQTQNQTTNQTSNPIAPDWYTGGLQDLMGRITEFGNSDASQLVAPASDLQNQAFTKAGQMQVSPLFGQAADMLGGLGGANTAGFSTYSPSSYAPAQAQAQGYQASQVGYDPYSASSLLDGGLEKYQNPYQRQVTDAYSTDFDVNAGKTRANQAAQGALNGAFGGSRYGIQEAQTEGELARARASGLGSILQGGFDRATSLADSDANRTQSAAAGNAANKLQAGLANQNANNSAGQYNSGLLANLSQFNTGALNTAGQFNANAADAAGQFNANAGNANQQFNAQQGDQAQARQLQAAGLLGDLGNSMSSNERANIGLLGDLGGVQQGIDANQRTAGLSQLQAFQQLIAGLPTQGILGQQVNGTSSGTSTGTQSQNPGLLGTIGQGAQTAASLAALFSDERLKENISYVGDWNGHRAYSYNYVWSPEPQVGVMAQEVAVTCPDAVRAGPGGFLMVDYGAL